MSTNKTENYGLHAWVLEDNFLLSEINENFAALDESVRMVAGSYEGDGATQRDIELGFTPAAVLLCDDSGTTSYLLDQFTACGGLFLPGCPIDGTPSGVAAEVTDTGFRVRQGTYSRVNLSGTRYHYIALR